MIWNRYIRKKLLKDFASDGPPDRNICSCTSAPNGHVSCDGHMGRQMSTKLARELNTIGVSLQSDHLTGASTQAGNYGRKVAYTKLGTVGLDSHRLLRH
ncbi:hypothetical protein TNCV_1437721 [Trichonephila clavipes]|nr:hypothetical protein TNCV_1437721 [Trichonephila clavipes]